MCMQGAAGASEHQDPAQSEAAAAADHASKRLRTDDGAHAVQPGGDDVAMLDPAEAAEGAVPAGDVSMAGDDDESDDLEDEGEGDHESSVALALAAAPGG